MKKDRSWLGQLYDRLSRSERQDVQNRAQQEFQVSADAVNHWFAGRRDVPGVEAAARLAKVFGISIAELFSEAGYSLDEIGEVKLPNAIEDIPLSEDLIRLMAGLSKRATTEEIRFLLDIVERGNDTQFKYWVAWARAAFLVEDDEHQEVKQ